MLLIKINKKLKLRKVLTMVWIKQGHRMKEFQNFNLLIQKRQIMTAAWE